MFIAQSPVVGLHFTPWQTCSIEHRFAFSGKHSATVQLMRENCLYTNIHHHSWVNWSNIKWTNLSNAAAQDSNPGSRSRVYEALATAQMYDTQSDWRCFPRQSWCLWQNAIKQNITAYVSEVLYTMAFIVQHTNTHTITITIMLLYDRHRPPLQQHLHIYIRCTLLTP